MFKDAVEHFNRQVSKRILGQTLTTEGGGSSGGAYALGKVHEKVRADISLADVKNLDETISDDLVRPLVDFNFGPQGKYPSIVAPTDSPKEQSAKGGI